MPSMVDIRRSASYRGALLLGLLMFLATSASADVIILRTGTQVTGTVANREQVATSPESFSSVGVLTVDETGERKLLQVPVQNINYILLEDVPGTRVVQFVGRQRVAGQPQTARPEPLNPVAIVLCGSVLCAFGALVKLGDEKLTVTNSSVKYNEKTYNGLNYALMIGGGLLATIGLMSLTDSTGKDRANGPVLALDNYTRAPQLGYRVRF